MDRLEKSPKEVVSPELQKVSVEHVEASLVRYNYTVTTESTAARGTRGLRELQVRRAVRQGRPNVGRRDVQ